MLSPAGELRNWYGHRIMKESFKLNILFSVTLKFFIYHIKWIHDRESSNNYWFRNPLFHSKTPFNPSHSLYLPIHPFPSPLCHLCAPSIPCTYPLSSLASLHISVTPVSPRSSIWSLAAGRSVMLTIYNHFSCHKLWN